MPDREHAAMDPMQSPTLEPMRDFAAPNAQRDELNA
jgi:hypothetical protein